MNYLTVILFILATGLSVAVFLKLVFRTECNWMDAHLIEEAEAVILLIELKNSTDHHKSRIRLQMQVQPDKGRNFVAEMEDAIINYNIAGLKTGSIVRVQYNSHTRALLHIIAA